MGQCLCIFQFVVVKEQERHKKGVHHVPMHHFKKNRIQVPVNIIDDGTNYCLFVDDRTTLVDGASDPSDIWAEFYINYYDPEDLTTFWLQNVAIASKVLAADFHDTERPRIIFVSFINLTCLI